MKEDEVVLEQLANAENRRVFYIDVGNLSPKDAQKAIDEAKKKFKEKMIDA